MIAMLKRRRAEAALLISLLALVCSTTGIADAGIRAARRALPGASTKPKALGILRLDRHKHFPVSVIPRARSADGLRGVKTSDLTTQCNAQSVDLGTYCMMSNPFPLTNKDVGKNNYFFAAQKCAEVGGYLPTAAQLIGAADRVRLAGSIGDSRLTASIDQDPTDGLKDRREMSATLITTTAGSGAAGSQGVSEGSIGDPKQGEPNPVPFAANPAPETLQYVTVYSNGQKGGFAGGKPVGTTENFRCAFNKEQGAPREIG